MKKLSALFPLLFLFSCLGSYHSIKHLEGDRIDSKNGFDSILILHLTIRDTSGKLPEWGNVSLWERYIGKTQKENRMSQHVIGPKWEKTAEGSQFTRTIYVQTRGGSHKILSLAFQSQSRILAFKTRVEYTVPEGRIAYLGNLVLNVGEEYKYGYGVSRELNNKEKVLGEFSMKYPGLYEKFGREYTLVDSKKVRD